MTCVVYQIDNKIFHEDANLLDTRQQLLPE
jgi:hypothetical protein